MGFIYLQGGASFQPWYILSYCSSVHPGTCFCDYRENGQILNAYYNFIRILRVIRDC